MNHANNWHVMKVLKRNVKKMLIVGQINNEEERNEARFVAQIFIVEERIKYLARANRKK